jgi:hypothetical protein
MESRLHVLMAKIKELEQELVQEIQKKEEEYYYKIFGRKVTFEEWIKHEQKSLVMKIVPFIRSAPLLNILTAPVVWSVLPFALLLDLAFTVFQFVCFPVYGIPKVKRGDYVVLDRHSLPYLNVIEKMNCEYCAYVNGLLAYLAEIAGRTEQYWCPIKHARKVAMLHRRYVKYFEYGDGAGFRKDNETVRRDFDDLRGNGTGAA